MQVLKLISIQGFAEGGSSRPLLITAKTEDGKAKQYVMKLFKSDYIEQNYSVAKEIFISELAKEFSLIAPDYALIKVEEEELLPYFSPDEIKAFDKGYKFCSEFMEQYTPVVNSLVSLQFIKQYDIENLFCFDNLIFNLDRGGFRNKPNLLLNDEDIVLIDHEQTLPFISNLYIREDINFFTYTKNYQHQLHIASHHLKSLRHKSNLFTEFFESLRFLNIEKFNALFDELDEFGIIYGKREKIFAYLNWAKTNGSFLNTHLFSIIK
ncbi:HipA family kinase [Flavobacterium hauense]